MSSPSPATHFPGVATLPLYGIDTLHRHLGGRQHTAGATSSPATAIAPTGDGTVDERHAGAGYPTRARFADPFYVGLWIGIASIISGIGNLLAVPWSDGCWIARSLVEVLRIPRALRSALHALVIALALLTGVGGIAAIAQYSLVA